MQSHPQETNINPIKICGLFFKRNGYDKEKKLFKQIILKKTTTINATININLK